MSAVEDTWSSEARAIVRCVSKTCKQAHVVTFKTTTTLRAFNNRPVYSHVVWRDGRPVTYRDRYDLHRIVLRDFACAGCGGRGATFKVVEGRFSESVKCGGKCLNAVGPSCDCQCGGENHGSGHTSF